jgi:hypothetical protein
MAFGRVRDAVLKATSNRQEPFVYGSLGGTEVSLVALREQIQASATPATGAPAPAEPSASLPDMRRDYEFFERVGSKEAWETFLKLYPSGPYTVLAREQMAKLATLGAGNQSGSGKNLSAKPAAGSERAPESAPFTVATALPDAVPTGARPGDAFGSVTRQLQGELRRVGCLAGSIDGDWNADSERALDSFNKFSGMRLNAKVANLDALDAVKQKQARVCPLVCERGYRADGDRCVQSTCRAGYVVDDDGDCVRAGGRTATRSLSHSESTRERRKASADKPARRRTASSGGRAYLSCGPNGCHGATARCTGSASFAGLALRCR